MNKKLMAVAVAGALAVPGMALAQSSTVQIGGSLTAFYYKHDPNNPSTGQSSDIMETSEPQLFVRGEEKLGGGLSVWFQCTSSLDGMIGGASQVTNSGLCARNSGIGFKGSFGNVFMGNWDAPQKLVFNRGRQWWGGTNAFTGGSAVLLDGGSASGAQNPVTTIAGVLSASVVPTLTQTTSNNPGSFFRRQAASWNYHSPSWGGFSVLGTFSANNEQTGNPELSTLSQRMFSLAGQYASGPLYLGVGYEKHSDYNPGNVAIGTTASLYAGGTDTNWTLVAGYRFGTFNVRALYSKSDYDVTNSGGLDVDGWGLFADWAIQGPHTLRAQYVTVGDTSGTTTSSVGSYKGPAGAGCGALSATSCATSTGADLFAVAYSYAFSKRTEGSFVYSRMSNDSGASFSKGRTASTAGNDQSNYGIVLKHSF